MPKQVTTLSIFLASPSDVAEERNTVKKVIDELNTTLLKSLNIQLELLNWENSTHPSFGAYPQDVINNQIGDDYDIFLGIFWTRCGTPTNKSQSGTLEEFDRAYLRQKKSRVEICLYFKADPADLYKIDLLQFQKVKDFKESVSKLGGYHWSFLSNEFETLIRNHLFKITQEWEQKKIDISHQLNLETAINIDDCEDEQGIFELFEDFTNHFKQVTESLNTYNDLAEQNNSMMNYYTKKLDQNPDDFQIRKKIINDTSDHLNNFAKKVKSQYELIEKNFELGFNKFDKFLNIYSDIHNFENKQHLTIMLKAFDNTIIAIPIMLKGSISFLEAIKQMPRMTTSLNRSKKALISSLEPFISYMQKLEITIKSIQVKGFDLLSALPNKENI